MRKIVASLLVCGFASLACMTSAMVSDSVAVNLVVTPPTLASEPTLFFTSTPEKMLVTVCADSLHVRSVPMGEIEGYVYSGDVLEVGREVDGWLLIVGGEWSGFYIRKKFVC